MASAVRLGSPSGGLPAEVTNFVGRRYEVGQVRRLLSAARLVTLIGVGGSGKTRLALRVAQESRRAFDDGVCLVNLAPLSDGSLLEYQIVEALGIDDGSDRSLSEIVLGYLRERELLLVLDNCEHLLERCAEFVARALRGAGGLRVLCTSRELLGIAGEHVYAVHPLPVPEPGQELTADARARYAGLALFLDRAAAAAPGFTMTADNWPTIVSICRRLDGLPLAIELAAARMHALSIVQLEAALRDRFDLLSTRAATPAHHRTLESAFDWSYALCSPTERVLWARLSVFADSFEPTAAQHVCGGAGLSADHVLGLLAGLVDKSVLIGKEHAGELRYQLLDTVRQYGLVRLRAGDEAGGVPEAVLRQRHRDWYLELAERFDARWFGPSQPEWAMRIHAELGNLRAALGHCLASPDQTHTGVRLAGALTYFWYGCGAVHEGRYWLEQALAADPHPSRDLLRALAGYTTLLLVQGEHVAAGERAGEYLKQAKQLDEPLFVARAMHDLGGSLSMRDDLAGARPLLEEAVARLELGAPHPFAALAKVDLAMVVALQGDAARAAELCTESREWCRTHGEQWWLGHALTVSAHAAAALDDPAQATAYIQEGLRVRGALNDTVSLASGLERLGWFAADSHDYPRAARLLGAADRQRRDIGQVLHGAAAWLRGHEERTATTRRALGDTAFEMECRRGAELTVDDAIAYAMGEAQVHQAPSRDDGPPLTRREREVAQLVARGLSNKQIAVHLMVAQRTAETHVENILRKLSCTNRTQIGIWIAQRADLATRPGR